MDGLIAVIKPIIQIDARLEQKVDKLVDKDEIPIFPR